MSSNLVLNIHKQGCAICEKMEEKENKENVLAPLNSVNLMELLPKIWNVEKYDFKITPSRYIKEMSLSMEDRYKASVRFATNLRPCDTNYPPQFRIIPSILVFQKFEARSTCCLSVEIQNVGKSLLPIKVSCPDSIYFTLNSVGPPVVKLASGLSLVCEITFTPKEASDYSHHFVVSNKDCYFEVPIIAIGARPMLDIPDEIVLNPAPVKIPITKFLSVRNIGDAPAIYNFINHSKHFQVSPSKGYLHVHDSMILKVSFESAKVEEVEESLELILETGEKLCVTLHGSAENVSIQLDENTVFHENTYVGLKRVKTVHLLNNSSSVIRFSWKRSKTLREDLAFIESVKNKYKELSELEILKNVALVHSGICNAEEHEASCKRILKDELQLLEKEEFSFTHDSFSIIPQSGEVWPKNSVDIMVSFEPKTSGLVTAQAYLEVSGTDSRLPLHIQGTGLGPKIVLNLKTLDIDNVYLCSLHRYELLAENRGDIPGTLEFMSVPLIFGGKVELSPESRRFKPGETAAFVVSFTSNRQGDFTEKIFFRIRESEETIFFTLKGRIICPMLYFDIKQIDFGIVPVGFPRVKEVNLNNLSMVPVTFSLRVKSDGDVESLSYERFAKLTIKPLLPLNPKEFQIEPEESVVEPFSSKLVTVTLTANRVGQYQTYLAVDMWDSDSEPMTCPITYQSVVANVVAEPNQLTIPFCFINFPYTRSITLRNMSKVPGFFYIIPSDPTVESLMTCSVSVPQGLLEPRESMIIDVTIITSVLGRQTRSINILVFGTNFSREWCTISCLGQGPIVSVIPNILSWEDVCLLENFDKTLEFRNESPIPASLTFSMAKTESLWSVSPTSIKIPPEESVTITLSLTLIDRGRFKDTLRVNIYNGKALSVILMATGVGSSLKIVPYISPKYDLRTLFSHKKYLFEISIENKGTKTHGICWSPYSEYKAFVAAKFVVNQDYPFKIEPVKMDINPKQTKTVTLEVYSETTGFFSHTFYCFVNVGVPTKELHLTTEICAEFVGPLVSFDKNELFYWYNIGQEGEEQKLEDIVCAINLSVLPITIHVNTSHPFLLEVSPDNYQQECELELKGFESREIKVKFIADTKDNRVSRRYNGNLFAMIKELTETSISKTLKKLDVSLPEDETSTLAQATVVLRGEVNYPNALITPKKINFGYIPVGTSTYLDIFLVNVSPLPIYYNIRWKAGSLHVSSLEEPPSPSQPLDSAESILDYFESEENEVEEKQEPLTERNSGEVQQNLIPPTKPVPKMPEIEISDSDVKEALFPLTRNYYNCENELVEAYKLINWDKITNEEPVEKTQKIFEVTPFYGTIEPFGSQTLTAKFYSDVPLKASVEAHLYVKAGPTETISLTGTSASLSFHLSTSEIDFGKQLFCEAKSHVLKIHNPTVMPFTFEADPDKIHNCDVVDNFPVGRGVLTVSPRTGTVKPFEKVDLSVKYHPGVPEKFETDFQLQIAFLNPVKIKVKGFGVFPQVHISLPRPDILRIDPEIGYMAVASLTEGWYLTEFSTGSSMYDLNSLKPYRSQESFLNSQLDNYLLDNAWEILKSDDFVPSNVDIQLAIERILAYDLLSKEKLANSALAIYVRTIPYLCVPAYSLDFGVCVTGCTGEQNVTVTNFGPLPVIMYSIIDSRLREAGIHVRMKNRQEIKIGASLSFIVSFHPRKSKYKKKYEKVQTSFAFEIYHGPKIPIYISAEVTYPYVVSSKSVIDFENVVCGFCKVVNLNLKNPGLVPATWTIYVKKTGDSGLSGPPNFFNEKSMFRFDNSSGSLEPGESCCVQVSFKPTRGGSFYSHLFIRVNQGLEELQILMMGVGVEPMLNISHQALNFAYTLPYPIKVEKIFSVENRGDFPIEFYFPEFDKQYKEEMRILEAIFFYYQTSEILLPVRKLGEGLPIELIEFYNMLMDGLNMKHMEEERKKLAAERERHAVQFSTSTLLNESLTAVTGHTQSFEKRKKKLKKLSRSKTSTVGGLSISSLEIKEAVVPSIFETKTEEEIDEMLREHITEIMNKDPVYDPIHAVINSILPPVPVSEYTQGTLIIFHGAPYTKSVQMANRASLFANMPVLNIDRIVMEEAAFGRCVPGVTAKQLIEQAYWDFIDFDSRRYSNIFDLDESEELKGEESSLDQELQEIQRKFTALVTLRETLLMSKDVNSAVFSAKSELSRKSRTPSSRPRLDLNSPIANISEDIVIEILKFRLALEVNDGLIIDKLQSFFFNSVPKALTALLKAAGNINDIIVVVLYNNYSNYSFYQQNQLQKQELEKIHLHQEALEKLEEEPKEVLESLNLTEEEAQNIWKLFLTQRQEYQMNFEKKKEAFYSNIRANQEALKRGLPLVPHLTVFPNEAGSSAGKKEKDSMKRRDSKKKSKSSEISYQTDSENKSGKFKAIAGENEFLNFEADFKEIKIIVENWDQRLGELVRDSESDTKPRKGHNPSHLQINSKPRRGVYFWVVNLADPETNAFPSCCHFLKKTLENRVKSYETNNCLFNLPEGMIFSVVTLIPKKETTTGHNVFTIKETENIVLSEEDAYENLKEEEFAPPIPSPGMKLNRSVSSISFKSKSKSSILKVKKIDSRGPGDFKNIRTKKTASLILSEVMHKAEGADFKSRWILQPGEMRSFLVKFFPTKTGVCEKVFVLNYVNSEKSEQVRCFGFCDIPHIDTKPETMFPVVEQAKPFTRASSPAYYYVEDAYDFGSIIAVHSSDGKRSTKKTVTITLANNSKLPVDMHVVTGEYPEDSTSADQIKFDPDRFWIKPEEKTNLIVTASPARFGPVSENLFFVIKDNPRVHRLRVKFDGVRPNVSVEPKLVNFDRLLLRRNEFRNAVITNRNQIPLYISLKNIKNLPPQLSFSQTAGWVQALESLTLTITYNATEVQTITNYNVVIQVFDNTETADAIQELSFDISAETYDAALDIAFASAQDDHIDFGDIRVENQYSIPFTLKNVGKYHLGYKIDLSYNYLAELENNSFNVTPHDGKLIPGKPSTAFVNLVAESEIIWKKIPLFKVLLLEPYFSDDLIAGIPIKVSARSHYSRYEIKPSGEFNFGHLRVGSVTTGSIRVENKGHFSLSYYVELQSPASAATLRYGEVSKKAAKQSASSVKERIEKAKKICRVGPFEISPSSGSAEPGSTAILNVSCNPGDVKAYQEKIVIFVKESMPSQKKGNPLFIKAEACLPDIRFDNYKNVFREHFACLNEMELNDRVKPGSYTLYTNENNTFYFRNMCICKSVEARIHLENSGLIECYITASVDMLDEKGNVKTPSEESEYFKISPDKLLIEPYNTGHLILTFRPMALEVYKARLRIILVMPDTHSDVIQEYNILGNGVVPQIEITEPNSKLPEGQTLVVFPPTSPQHHSTASIAFTNTGVLDCKVIVELYRFQNGIFTLTPKPETEKMLKVWELSKPIHHTVIVSMSPGEEAKFKVTFSPQEIQSYTSHIKLFIVDNPFENWCYKLVGEVFLEEVIIEKIRTSIPFLSENEDDESSATAFAPGHYFVNFSDCCVNKKSKVLLRLKNKTEQEYFKFQWDETQSISVSPNSGHLYPNSFKEILFVFHPEEPMELEDMTIYCTLNKIQFESPPKLSWDTRLMQCQSPRKTEDTISINKSNNKERISTAFSEAEKVNSEPAHVVIPDSNKILYVNVSGIADYPKLTCKTTQIAFKETFMFQSRSYSVVLENPGNIAVEYKLILKSVIASPIKFSKDTQVKESSLLRMSQSFNRPQSSGPSSSGSRPLSALSRCGRRPRPLTGELKNKSLDSTATELSIKQVAEESKTVNYVPFTIENGTGCIQPKQTVSFNLIFSPMDISQYKAVLSILVANLHPEYGLPEIEVTASSIMPYCHFDIPESDYLISGRRDCTLPGPMGYAPGLPLNPDTKTIEIKVLGVGVTTPIKFHVINPTDEDYSFSWLNVTRPQPTVIPSFYCSTLDGEVRAGRQHQMLFSFVSQKVGITEAFWKFVVTKFGVDVNFLFVGDVRQPSVYFLSNHINFRPTFIGSISSASLILVNNENDPFEFYFIQDSLYSEGRLNCLKVEPSSGKVLPNSEISIRVTFTGKTLGKTFFNLKCKLKSIRELFLITVEAITYSVKPLVSFEDLKKVKHFADMTKENVIDFGTELNPNIPETITLTIMSLSKTSFYYYWEYDHATLDSRNCQLKFSVKNGHIRSFKRGTCDITILFTKKSSLVKFPVTLKVRRGPSFRFIINGSASIPPLEFSFNVYDFGYCFLQEKEICFYETVLTVKNKDISNVYLETFLSEYSAFSHNMTKPMLLPGNEISIPVYFHPKECIPYEDVIKFTINGIHEKHVYLKGQGTEFKVALANPKDTTIFFGAVKIGKTSTREFSLVNRSFATVTLLVGFSDQLPVNGRYLAKPKENPIDLSQGHRLTGLVTISPSTTFKIKPKEEFKLKVTYKPKARTSSFTETVSLQFHERTEPICVLTGCCLGPAISLDKNCLNFGSVVKSCMSFLKFRIINSGNIGARFEWKPKEVGYYTISPSQGYCSPESEVTIKVTFKPTNIGNCIKALFKCSLFLSENEKYPSLHLNVIGDCVAVPEPSEILYFECFVRKSDQRTIEITNPSGNEWQLVPIYSGDYFKGVEGLVLPPLSSGSYDIEYWPLTMTKDGALHKGSLFFRLPNGKGLLYELRGVALPPNPEEEIEREVPCKTKCVEILKIKNWLQYPQRFTVKIIPDEGNPDLVHSCTGLGKLEVPANTSKDYTLNFFAHKLGFLKFEVVFLNEKTKEFVWFKISFQVVMCEPLEVIILKSGVRQTCEAELKLENPLNVEIQYKLETTSHEVQFESPECSVPPLGIVYVKMFYVPIHPGERIEKLTVECPELGVFPRILRLFAVGVSPEPPRTFQVPLGSSQTQGFVVTNLSHLNAYLRSKTNSEDFLVNDHGTVEAGQSTTIDVTYEPSEIGTTSATLTVESEQAGNFQFGLTGICGKPLAKGPFIVKPNHGTYIPFKNTLKMTKEFYMYVDNPLFILKTTEETLSPKEECKILIGLQKTKASEKSKDPDAMKMDVKFPAMGQLIVECFNPYIKWQFYLKATLDK